MRWPRRLPYPARVWRKKHEIGHRFWGDRDCVDCRIGIVRSAASTASAPTASSAGHDAAAPAAADGCPGAAAASLCQALRPRLPLEKGAYLPPDRTLGQRPLRAKPVAA